MTVNDQTYGITTKTFVKTNLNCFPHLISKAMSVNGHEITPVLAYIGILCK